MRTIDLRSFQAPIKKEAGTLYIFDGTRRKHLVFTPEEWVRQAFINFLQEEHHYPRSLMRIEGGLSYDRRQKRSDVVVYDRRGQPFMLVECKAMTVSIDQSVLTQALEYNFTIKAPLVCLTNGFHYQCFRLENGSLKLLETMPAFPPTSE